LKDRGLRIAVAEDEAIIRLFLEETLTDLGHEVVLSVETGEALMAQGRACAPDLLVVDIGLPGVDGVQAAREVVRRGPVAVVFLTGHAEETHPVPPELAHIHLTKPVDSQGLRTAIEEALERFRQAQGVSPLQPPTDTA